MGADPQDVRRDRRPARPPTSPSPISPDTTIVTVTGKKIELKDLKKGDGVGISHVNSVASKVVVNVKPVD